VVTDNADNIDIWELNQDIYLSGVQFNHSDSSYDAGYADIIISAGQTFTDIDDYYNPDVAGDRTVHIGTDQANITDAIGNILQLTFSKQVAQTRRIEVERTGASIDAVGKISYNYTYKGCLDQPGLTVQDIYGQSSTNLNAYFIPGVSQETQIVTSTDPKYNFEKCLYEYERVMTNNYRPALTTLSYRLNTGIGDINGGMTDFGVTFHSLKALHGTQTFINQANKFDSISLNGASSITTSVQGYTTICDEAQNPSIHYGFWTVTDNYSAKTEYATILSNAP